MTQEQKVIRVKVGVLELAKQLGNVSQACLLAWPFPCAHAAEWWHTIRVLRYWIARLRAKRVISGVGHSSYHFEQL
jgi:hypothetical protein